MDLVVTNFNAVEPQANAYQAWYEQSVALTKESRYEEALASCNKALVVKSDYHTAWIFRGVILIQMGCYEGAIASCEKALEIHPDEKQAWIVRGAALNYLGRYKQSYASYDQALGIQRQSVWQTLTQVLKGIFKLGNGSGTTDTTTANI